MSKKLNHSLVIGILLIGIFSANVSQAQTYTNVYWYPSNALGGTGPWGISTNTWSTNSTGAGTLTSSTTLAGNGIYNFSGTLGTVTSVSSITVGGMNWLTSGYTLISASNLSYTATDTNIATGTNSIFITSSANLNITGSGLNLKGLSMTGGAGSTVTLTNALAATTTVLFGTSSANSGRTNSVNTIIAGGGTIVLGTTGGSGFTQAGNITNNSTGTFVLTNNTTGSVNIAGAISGTGAVTLANTSGDISLRANSYSGGTFIQNPGGEVRILDSSAFGSGAVTIAGAGTNWVRSMGGSVNITNNIGINSGSIYRISSDNSGWKFTSSGLISGAGSMILSSGETNVLGNTNNSFGGGVNIASSTKLQVNSIGTSGSNSSLGTNGTITFSSLSGSGGAGELYWLGNTNETSDKTIALTTVSTSGSAGMKIYAGGDGLGGTNVTLTLNGNINSTAATNLTITLGAFNTNTLVMNGTINQAAGYTNSLVVGNTNVGTVVLGNTNNSFGGGLTINAGSSATNTVQVARIGNAGANSSLGTNGTINIGGSIATGVNILKYVGTGETSDKVINLAGTVGGPTLDQSGTGNLKFNSVMTGTGTGAKTITLQGSTSGTGELAGAISDQGTNVISLYKSGSGAWTLSGNNTYTGTTTFAGGTSIVSGDNSAAVGSVTISGSTTSVRLDNTNAISRASSLRGTSATTNNTLDLRAAGDFTFNSYGAGSLSADAGHNMTFTNSSGSQKTVTFTNATNYLTSAAAGGRTLANNSSNLNLNFDGNIEIGSTATDITTFTGAGNFNVGGNLLDTGANGIRTLQKSGNGTLTLRGNANSYRGSTLVSGGTLEVGTVGALPTASAITVSSGATLRFLKSSGGINVGAMTNSGTLEQNLVTIASSGAVNLTGSTLKVNGTPTLASYTLVSGASLTGTPTLSGATGYYLSASGNNLLLLAAPSSLSYSSINGTVATGIASVNPTVTGTPTSYSISPALPAGLSLNTTSGVISGTPSVAAASATYTVTASNQGGSTTATFTVAVGKAAQAITGLAATDSKTFGAADYTLAVTKGASSSALSFASSEVGVATVDATTGLVHVVGAGTTTLTVNQVADANYNAASAVTQTLTVGKAAQAITGLAATDSKTFGAADYTLAVTKGASSSALSYSSSNTDVATINPTTGLVHVVGAGTTTLTVNQVADANYNAASAVTQTLTVTASAPTGLSYSSSSINGTVGVAIASLNPTVTGSGITYSIDPALPSGLLLNPTTGVISGTPSVTAASAIYTVTATNVGGSTTTTLTIVVGYAVEPVPVDDALTKPADNKSFLIPVSELLKNDYRITNSSGARATDGLSVTAVASGLGNTAVLSGVSIQFTPSNGSTDTFTYTVTDGTKTATATVTITTETQAPAFTLQFVKQGMATFAGGNTTVTHDFLGVPGQTYLVEYATDLTGAWTSAGNQNTGATGSFSVTFTKSGDVAADWNAHMFFRARLVR